MFKILAAIAIVVSLAAPAQATHDCGIVNQTTYNLGPDGVGGIEIMTVTEWDDGVVTVTINVISMQ